MRDKFLVFALFFAILSCSEEDLPIGLYDYQVERLLSGQSGDKTWMQIVSSTDCKDSLKLLIESASDSLDIFEIRSALDCNVDTIYIGKANASKLIGGLLFADSLVFSDGTYWIVKQITSDFLDIQRNGKQESYLHTLD
ncbi:hypothetical protein [Ekhidna sp.]|uniref:hypothetical protein n=1 Tax=Ekhidna sp. TaxID=2608089 RepID=UPI003BAB443A